MISQRFPLLAYTSLLFRLYYAIPVINASRSVLALFAATPGCNRADGFLVPVVMLIVT